MVEASGGTLAISGALAGAGTIAIDLKSVLSVAGTVNLAGGAVFLNSGGALDIAQLGAFTAAISGFNASDSIDLLGSAVTGLSFVGSGLTIDGGGGVLGTLTFTGESGQTFGFAADGHGGTNIFLA